MSKYFRAPDRRQLALLPVDMMDWLPKDDIIHMIVDAVSLMYLSAFKEHCKVGGAGNAPFAPDLLLSLLIYAYSHGVRSSRVIERLCRRDAGYRFIVGDETPDHTVIARFRRRHAERMGLVFRHVLELCHEAGLIRLGVVALDGTKVKANAALDANRTASTLDEHITRMMAEAEATDAREDRQFGAEGHGDALPGKLRGRTARLARLKACKEKLERRAAEAVSRQQDKIAAREAEEQASGIATQKDHKQRAALRDAPPPRGRMPKNLSARQRMDRKLRTKRSRAIYRRRGASVEPVFGQMKDRQGADRFSMRGLDRCRGEWLLHAAVHNLRKIHRKSVRSTNDTRKGRKSGPNAAW